ncbi:MAG TPA: flagellar export chaperone FliS, partial [Planctomycetaceae bacterium]|nr:flagellar export chaperone FliS [Planctomycetaceae bacterium]
MFVEKDFMQQNTPRQNYIQAEVATATPQKLQLLLIEAAMKNIYRTKMLWKECKFDIAFDSLVKAQDIVAEILCSFDKENFPDLAKKLASIYVFIFRRLAEAGMSHDEGKLDDALRVLTSERETWQLVCEKFGSSTADLKTPDSLNVGGNAAKSAGPASNAWTSATAGVAPSNPAARNSAARLDISATTSKPGPGSDMPKPTSPRPLVTKPLVTQPL